MCGIEISHTARHTLLCLSFKHHILDLVQKETHSCFHIKLSLTLRRVKSSALVQ